MEKILEGAALTPSGMPADSIVYMIQFDDDPDGLTYKVSGFRRTGFPADDFLIYFVNIINEITPAVFQNGRSFFIKDTLIILNLHLIYTVKINIVIEP